MSKNKSLLLVVVIIVILVLVIGVMVFVNQKRSQQSAVIPPVTNLQATIPALPEATGGSQPALPPPSQEVVFVSAAGFTPNFVSVKAGMEVVFINSGNENHQIASDPHPLHTNLPGFNSGVLKPGESYTYRFEKAGDWGYHDHLNPNLTGRVVVTP